MRKNHLGPAICSFGLLHALLSIGTRRDLENHPKVGASWEGYAVEEVLRRIYYSLFPLPEGRSNYVIDFADYLSVVCLDSGHTQTPAAQVDWPAETLERRRTAPTLFACYHKPTFGTLLKADHSEVRTHFVPLFDRYGVDAAFENDHHAVYKRTLPLKQGRIHEAGTLYLGDGAWGVNTRAIPWDRADALDYLVRGESRNHLIRVTLFEDRQQFDAYDGDGVRFDSYARFR